MIAALTILLACQCCGEILVRAAHLPLPGPVAGFGLLFAGLVVRGRGRSDPDAAVPAALGAVSDTLLRNLSLLFIPASVGVVQYLGLLRVYALQLALVIAGSTVAALVATALTFSAVARVARPSKRAPAAHGVAADATPTDEADRP